MSSDADIERRRRIRRSTVVLALLPIGVYVTIIALSIQKGS